MRQPYLRNPVHVYIKEGLDVALYPDIESFMAKLMQIIATGDGYSLLEPNANIVITVSVGKEYTEVRGQVNDQADDIVFNCDNPDAFALFDIDDHTTSPVSSKNVSMRRSNTAILSFSSDPDNSLVQHIFILNVNGTVSRTYDAIVGNRMN